MYTFRQSKSNLTIEYDNGKIYDTLGIKYFMLTEPQDEMLGGVFARKLDEKEMEGEDKLYPDGYITFNAEKYPVVVITNRFTTFEESDAAVESYQRVLQQLEYMEGQGLLDNDDVKESKNTVPGTLVYYYMFNYFGGEKYNDKMIDGAGIGLAIRVYKDGEEKKFLSEDEVTHRVEGTNNYNCLNDVFDVSYDPKTEFSITKNPIANLTMRLNLDCDKIECEVVDYQLYYLENEFMSVPMEVNESEFRAFIKAHGRDFDISDNKPAQVPGVGMI